MQFALSTPVPNPASACDHRYSAGNCCFQSASRGTGRAFPDADGGRGPPERGARSELQAMSNSLQLT